MTPKQLNTSASPATTRARVSQPASRAAATRLTAALLIGLLAPTPACLAQSAAAIETAAPAMLHITILEGEDALNNIKERTAREPIIQVEDSNHKPVAGVVIVFTSLRGSSGAGGTFNQATSFRTVTDANGRAVGRGFKPNTTEGQFTISVQASLGAMVASAVIREINTAGGGAAASSSSVPAADATTQPAAASTTTAGSHAGGATASAGGKIAHAIRLIPKWAVAGVVAGAASAIAISVATNNSGATISTGGGTVTAPTGTAGGATKTTGKH